MTNYDSQSRRLARKRYWEENARNKYVCPDCQRTEDEIVGEFQVHHQNGSPHDNRLEHLVGLCGFCHRLREGKKPSIERIRRHREQNKQLRSGKRDNDPNSHAEVDKRVLDFIDERACLHSEGRDYTWIDPFVLWTDCLTSFLQREILTDELINDLICVLTLAPETVVEPREHGIAVLGPDPHGRRNCDCLTAEKIPVRGRKPSLGDSS
jgi:hypothetical protein